jgi:phosphatidylglycerol---prolipoprotein diacylglyceryl transferase
MLGTIIGARLGHVLFYQPDYFLSHPWEILMVWHGGLASHGGAAAKRHGIVRRSASADSDR